MKTAIWFVFAVTGVVLGGLIGQVYPTNWTVPYIFADLVVMAALGGFFGYAFSKLGLAVGERLERNARIAAVVRETPMLQKGDEQ